MKLLSIQFLRGWEAIVVVTYHSRGLITKRASVIGAEHILCLVMALHLSYFPSSDCYFYSYHCCFLLSNT